MFLKEILYFNKSDRQVFITALAIAIIAMTLFIVAGSCNATSNEVDETVYVDELEDEEETSEEESEGSEEEVAEENEEEVAEENEEEVAEENSESNE